MPSNPTSKEPSPVFPLQDGKASTAAQDKRLANPSADLSTCCVNCKTKKTPLWRRAANGDTLCNACGLYLKTNNAKRPNCMSKRARCDDELDPSQDSRGTCPGDGNCNGTGGAKACDGCPVYHQQHDTKKDLVCFNCHTTTTPLWRKDREGNIICNACGLFYKLNNAHRPVTLKTGVIKRRKRVVINKKPKQDTDSGEHEVPEVSSTRLAPPGSKKEAPVPSIEDFPYSSFKKNAISELRPKQVISFSSESEEQASNSAALTFSPNYLETNPVRYDRCLNSFKPPTPEDSYTYPSTYMTSEHSPSQFEPRPVTPAWPSYPADTSLAMGPPAIDRDTLIAHRNKIQQEVENLNRLLSSTSSILQGIDRLIYPPEQAHHTVPDAAHSQVTLPPLRYVTEPYNHVPNAPESHYQCLPPMYPAAPPQPYYTHPQNFR
ncbi:Suppressor of ferric uptake 1 [Entomophthora muscae]|uniref:Suppressor of ferric uptake 1 n=1 Tax=Entomophthora muscae TaxID=34485 RepID=A0ACC2SIS3_9FUNG|nr:Suppressor of ferric uptake 1 [Entomophthora muscae]